MIDFDKLSKSQIRAFEQIATNNDAAHSKRTVDSLVRMGAVQRYRQIFTMPYWHAIIRYSVPLDVHIDWCNWCGELQGRV